MNTKSAYIEVPGYRGETEIHVCRQVTEHPQAQVALELMGHLAIATAAPDGEDSAGRAKLRLMTPAEIVQRACAIADTAYAEFEDRGWLLALPLPKPQKSKEEL